MTTPDAALPAVIPPRRRWLWPLLIVALVAVPAGAGTSVWLATRPTVAPANDVKATIVQLCRADAARQLKAPTSAKWSDESTYQTTDGHWHVEGAIDAQNSFGAMIRSRYTCDALYIDGHWVPGVRISDIS